MNFPDFTLHGSDGRQHSLADYRGRILVVYFYPKDDTPGCTLQACGFRDLHPDFMRLDATVIGVSADGLPAHQKFVNKHGLPFVLLADTEHALCERAGVWQQKHMAGRTYMGIVRSTFLIGPDGGIVREWRGVRVAGHVEEVLTAIALLKGGGPSSPGAAAVAAVAALRRPEDPVVVPASDGSGTAAAMAPQLVKVPPKKGGPGKAPAKAKAPAKGKGAQAKAGKTKAAQAPVKKAGGKAKTKR
jgi:peroxiredoxin Q/BCP